MRAGRAHGVLCSTAIHSSPRPDFVVRLYSSDSKLDHRFLSRPAIRTLCLNFEQELRRGSTEDSAPTAEQDVSDLGLFQRQQDGRDDNDVTGGGRGAGAVGAKVYSAQEMRQRYYEAFWRARCVPPPAAVESEPSCVSIWRPWNVSGS